MSLSVVIRLTANDGVQCGGWGGPYVIVVAYEPDFGSLDPPNTEFR